MMIQNEGNGDDVSDVSYPPPSNYELIAETTRKYLNAGSYSCPNRCDAYQNIKTRNPFANCGRCGTRLVQNAALAHS